VTVAVTLALLVVFLFALQVPGPASAPTATPLKGVLGTATVTADANAVALVDGDPISRVEWQKAVAIDRAMSQLAGQTAPNAEVTLDRLINQRLVLRQAGNKISASDANATERLASLQQNWRADDAAVDHALASVNLSRQDLLAEIKRLLVVESYLKQVQDAAGWLAAQRAQAQVGVLTELTAPPVTPTLAAQNFTTQFGLTYPLLLDRDGAVSERYQVRGIPTTVFLDADGVVRARHVGPLTEDKFAEYVTPLLISRADPKGLENPSGLRTAPDFSLPRENSETIRLSDYRDKSSVVLVFYRGQT
jgi:hypothetical protein